MKHSVLVPVPADEHKVMKVTMVGRAGENGAASSDVMTSASGTQEIRQGVCKEQARSSVRAPPVQVAPCPNETKR